jgi:flagellar assembly protein FliH
MSSFERVRRSVPTALDPFVPGRTVAAPVERAPEWASTDGSGPAAVGTNGGPAGHAPARFPDLRVDDAPGSDAGTASAASAEEVEATRRAAYAAGAAAERAAIEQQRGTAAGAFAEALAEVARFRSGLLDRYQRELLELALGIARKVVQRELAEHPEHWLGMIREAVQQALARERIRVRAGASLHRYLQDTLPALRASLEDVQELELVEDVTLTDEGCVLETDFGDLDLGVDNQIQAVRTALAHGA